MRHDYEEGDVQEILKRAVRIDTHAQAGKDAMRAAAAELGISDEALAKAELQWMQEKGEQNELAEFAAQHRRSFWEHFATYLMVNAFLVCIFLVGNRDHFWPIYPILGWGIGIAVHAISTFNSNSDEFQKEFEKWRRRKKRRANPEPASDADDPDDE